MKKLKLPMLKLKENDLVGLLFGILLGVVINSYLIWDVCYFSILQGHSPLDFIWGMHRYLGFSDFLVLISLPLIFVIVQGLLTMFYCTIVSSLLLSHKKIVPPSYVLSFSMAPLLIISIQFLLQLFTNLHAADPFFLSYFLGFFMSAVFLLVIGLFLGSLLDGGVRKIIGAYSDTNQIRSFSKSYKSSLSFQVLKHRINDIDWYRKMAGLYLERFPDGDEASVMLSKFRTPYNIFLWAIKEGKEAHVFLIPFEEVQNRFVKELEMNEEALKFLKPQIDLIEDYLNLNEISIENGQLDKALSLALKPTKAMVDLKRYGLHVGLVVINIVALLVLSYLVSLKQVEQNFAIAAYSVILMVSLEIIRFKTKK